MLLINPASEKFGGFLSRYVPVGIPTAIGYIAAYLGKHNIPCKVLDEEIIDITLPLLKSYSNVSVLSNLLGASYAGIENHFLAIKYYNKAFSLPAAPFIIKKAKVFLISI